MISSETFLANSITKAPWDDILNVLNITFLAHQHFMLIDVQLPTQAKSLIYKNYAIIILFYEKKL